MIFSRYIFQYSAIYLFLYIGDEKAQGVAMKALFYGYWKSLTPLQIAFLPCIVMSTAENLHYQVIN